MFKLNDKVMVYGIDGVGTIVGKDDNHSWIVLFEEPPFDKLIGDRSEWKAYCFHESGLAKQ